VSSYKNTYNQWQKYLTEARYDFEPGSTTNNIPSEIKDAVENYVIEWGSQIGTDMATALKAGDTSAAHDLIAWKRFAIADQDQPQWLYFYREDQPEVPIPITSEEFGELWGQSTLQVLTGTRDYPSGQPSAAELAMGNLWVRSAVASAEQQLGREIDVPMAVETVPELEFPDLGISDEEELSTIDLGDFDLQMLGLEEPEPEVAPVPAEMAPEEPEATTEPEAAPEEPEAAPEDATEPEPDEPVEPEEFDKIIAGINSLSYPDSLLNMLKNVNISGAQKRQLLSLLLQATEQDDIVLEAIGDPQRDPRTFSPETTEKLNDLLDSFGLDPKAQKNLEKVLNKWAKLNTVKFSKGPDYGQALPPEELPPEIPRDDEGGEDEVTDAPEDEEEEWVNRTTPITLPGEDPGEEEPDEPTETGEAEEEDTDEKAQESKVLSIIGSSLDAISAAGVFPPAEATLIPTGATLASLGLNLYQKKMGWALLDLIALVPWAGKFAKAGSLGKIAKTVAATGKTGKALAATTKAMKLADPAFKATKIAKGVAGVKELYEHVPEEYIRIAVYTKTDDGKKYYIDFVLEVLGYVPHPIIKAGVEALKEAVVWIRKDLGGPPKEPTRSNRDVPEPGMDPSELAETLDRWQTIAGINKRIL